jgi:hypothetical protein
MLIFKVITFTDGRVVWVRYFANVKGFSRQSACVRLQFEDFVDWFPHTHKSTLESVFAAIVFRIPNPKNVRWLEPSEFLRLVEACVVDIDDPVVHVV